MDRRCQLIFSLDASNRKDFLRWVEATQNVVDIYKIGLVPFTLLGNDAIRILKDKGKKVFLDLKFFDIPNTMIKASLNALSQGVDIIDFHLAADDKALGSTLDSVRNQALSKGVKPPLLIGVTVLTSTDKDSKMQTSVLSLSEKAHRLKFDGVVLSGQEAVPVRDKFGDSLILICPGIRLDNSSDDQKRVVKPRDIKDIADFIVVGRPIYGAKNPEKIAREIKKELEEK